MNMWKVCAIIWWVQVPVLAAAAFALVHPVFILQAGAYGLVGSFYWMIGAKK